MMSHNHMSPEMIIRYNVSSVDMRRPSSGKAVADISKQWMEANPRNFLDLDRPHRHRKTARATPSIKTRKSEFNAQSFCLENEVRLFSTCYCSLSLDVNSFESTDLLVDPYHKLPHVHLHYHVFKVKSVEFVNTIAKSKTDRSGNVKAIIMFNSILSSASPHSPRSKPRTTGCKLKTSRSPVFLKCDKSYRAIYEKVYSFRTPTPNTVRVDADIRSPAPTCKNPTSEVACHFDFPGRPLNHDGITHSSWSRPSTTTCHSTS